MRVKGGEGERAKVSIKLRQLKSHKPPLRTIKIIRDWQLNSQLTAPTSYTIICGYHRLPPVFVIKLPGHRTLQTA